MEDAAPLMEQFTDDPKKLSYPQSAASNVVYRMAVTGLAIVIIILGKKNLPYDGVDCIDDYILNWLEPFSVRSEWLGNTLMTISNLLVDVTFLMMLGLWYKHTEDAGYVVAISSLAALKLVSTISFQAQAIPNAFEGNGLLPSLLGGQVYQYDYFFNAHVSLLLINALQLHRMESPALMKVCAASCAYVSVISLMLRKDFLMDIVIALAAGHLLHRLSHIHHPAIHSHILVPLLRIQKGT